MSFRRRRTELLPAAVYYPDAGAGNLLPCVAERWGVGFRRTEA